MVPLATSDIKDTSSILESNIIHWNGKFDNEAVKHSDQASAHCV